MNPEICLLYAPIITVAVSILKRWGWLARHPKVVAAVLAVVATGISVSTGHLPPSVAELAKCVAIEFAGAVATYEVVNSARGGSTFTP